MGMYIHDWEEGDRKDEQRRQDARWPVYFQGGVKCHFYL